MILSKITALKDGAKPLLPREFFREAYMIRAIAGTTKQLALKNDGLPLGFIPLLFDFYRPGVMAKVPLQGNDSSKLVTKPPLYSYESSFVVTKVPL